MELKEYKFPKLDGVDLTFSTIKTDRVLLEEAKKRGFYDGSTPYNKLFSSLFYGGGKVIFKNDIDVEYCNNAWKYCRALMKSFEPKHDDKEAVCAMLMSELVEPELAKA